jgi:threonine dehydrogenase-like Zn-dependent dehydrogenase
MSVNWRCWELTGADEPPVLVEYDIGRPNSDEVLVKIDTCTWWSANLAYSYGGVRSNPERSPELHHRVCGHVVEAGANALYFTDRAVVVPVVAPTAWETLGKEIGNGCADCIIVPASELHLLEQDGLVASDSSRAFFHNDDATERRGRMWRQAES